VSISYEWRGAFENAEINALHADGFDHPAREDDWQSRVERHSLGWVCARDGDDGLVGFANVAWDGMSHAFVLDTLVATAMRRQGVGRELIAVAVTEARAAGCEWLHADFDVHLRAFYLEACGFAPTNAGLVAL